MPAYEQWLRYVGGPEAGDDKLYLTCPDASYAETIIAYRQEFLQSGESMDGTVSLIRQSQCAPWLEEAAFYADPDTVITNGWVKATQLICIRRSDRKMVGAIHVRHTLNDYLKQFAGHVGYSVAPSERRKGYAKWMLAHVIPYCHALGIAPVMLSCSESNTGSRSTILANGGKLIRREYEPDEKDWLEIYHIE
ncbi:MAG: GNAT family N-acetyltransferase [Clostridia bacterium]|nr:GNAT family N-acetyltransferase [Clostridia bacterium]